MSFIKKLFSWMQPKEIQEEESCLSYVRYDFPKRDFYNQSQPLTKQYINQSCETDKLFADCSVQCEIKDPPLWHKKSHRTHKKSKKIKFGTVDNDNDENGFIAPPIDITIDLPKKKKESKFIIRDFDLTGVEDFVKPKHPKTTINFIFDDKAKDLSDNEASQIDFSKLKRKEPINKEPIHIQQKSPEIRECKSLNDVFNSILEKEKGNDEINQSHSFMLNLPKPKGQVMFCDSSDSSD